MCVSLGKTPKVVMPAVTGPSQAELDALQAQLQAQNDALVAAQKAQAEQQAEYVKSQETLQTIITNQSAPKIAESPATVETGISDPTGADSTASTAAQDAILANSRRGRRALRIDLSGVPSTTGLNIPVA